MKHLKNYSSLVILSEAKNPFTDFLSKRWILRRCAPQNDNTREFFRGLESFVEQIRPAPEFFFAPLAAAIRHG
jgi:hypothetical protein